MKTPCCEPQVHTAIKADPERWKQMKPIGTTTYEYDGTTYHQDWRNCIECNTTMVVETPEES